MWKKFWKKYGKLVAAAVFLTVAGLCYGFAESRPETVPLDESGRLISEREAGFDGKRGQIGAEDASDFEKNGAEDEAKVEVEAEAKTKTKTKTETSPVSMCYVHVCGEVNTPGVYELPEGSRIFEAVDAAGGFTAEAAESSLNLAETIADGMQLVVLNKEEAQNAAEIAVEQAAGLVNINKASKEQLMTLPGIGESRAEDILRYREESGGFQKIEDIMKVSGIKDAAFQKIKDSITV